MTSHGAKTQTPTRHGDPRPETPDMKTAKAVAATVIAASTILAIAHSLVKDGWSHRCMAKNARNQACPPDDPEATAWSVDGAIWLAAKKWRDEVNDQHDRATRDEQAPQKGGALHRHHSGPRCPMEIMALETVLQTVGLPITHNCRKTWACGTGAPSGGPTRPTTLSARREPASRTRTPWHSACCKLRTRLPRTDEHKADPDQHRQKLTEADEQRGPSPDGR